MLYHTTSEVTLDVVLMLMQWEEALIPSEASEAFKKKLMARVRSEFPK